MKHLISKRLGAALLPIALTSCGTTDLGKQSCMPIAVPTTVTLLERVDRNSIYFQVEKGRVPTYEPGERISLQRITQKWGMNGRESIVVHGTFPNGQKFEFHWGVRDYLWRAPWEPADIGGRTVKCEQ